MLTPGSEGTKGLREEGTEGRKRAALRRALMALPREEHLAILLTYDHAMTAAEVAAVLEKPVREATTLILRARRRLREALTREEHGSAAT